MKPISEGQCVKHAQYGVGYITASDAERTTIDFDDHGEKLFVTELMTVEIAGDMPARTTTRSRRKKATAARPAAREPRAAKSRSAKA